MSFCFLKLLKFAQFLYLEVIEDSVVLFDDAEHFNDACKLFFVTFFVLHLSNSVYTLSHS